METIEQQLADLRKKAAMFDNLKNELMKHHEAIIALANFLESLNPTMKSRKSSSEYRDMIMPLYKALLNGDKVSYTMAEIMAKCGLSEYYQAQQALAELLKLDGVEKVRDGKNIKVIFHVNKSGATHG